MRRIGILGFGVLVIIVAIFGEALLRDFSRDEKPEVEKPIVDVHTLHLNVDSAVYKESYTQAFASFDGDTLIPMSIKYRGNSSYSDFDKPQYRIVFQNKSHDKAKDIALFGMNEGSDWVLYGPFLDRTLLRSKLFLDISRELLPWSPDSRFVEVYLNDNYEGLYLVIEAVQVNEHRIGLYEKGLLSGETAYLVWRERVGQEDNPIKTYGSEEAHTSYELSVGFPSSRRITQAQLDWISSDISRFEKALYGDDFLDDRLGYRSYVNLDTFVDYFLINELAMLSDAGSLSTPMYKDLKGRLTMSVWDFNNALDNYYTEKRTDVFYLTEVNYFEQMIKDPVFVGKVLERYESLRKTTWQNDALINRLETLEMTIADAQVRNFARYGYVFEKQLLAQTVDGITRDPKSYNEALEKLKATLLDRLEFMDEHLKDLYAFTF